MEKSLPLETTVGKQKVVDKTIKPLTTTLTSLTPALVTSGIHYSQLGTTPIGYYKGAAAFWDLDLAVNQPNVLAEQQHILGILDGREEGYDIVTINVPVTAVPATAITGTLTVPAGEVWYVSAIQMTCAGDAAAGFTINWACSLWTDRVTALAIGQTFRTPGVALASAFPAGLTTRTPPGGGAIVQLDEFGEIATAWSVVNKTALLRLPAGTVLTFIVLPDTLVPAVITACTLTVFGSMGRVLVA